jgi:hypothetical protein
VLTLQAIRSELSQLEGSGGVLRLREPAHDLDRQLREVQQQMEELAAQEKLGGKGEGEGDGSFVITHLQKP